MRKRIPIKVNIQDYIENDNREYERRRFVFTQAIQSIIKEKNVSYREAKSLLRVKLRFDLMRRELSLI